MKTSTQTIERKLNLTVKVAEAPSRTFVTPAMQYNKA